MSKFKNRKYAAVCITAAAAAVFSLQPGSPYVTRAYAEEAVKGSAYWDSSEDGSYSYYTADERKVTKVNKTYDDGTHYTAEYQYNSDGQLIYSAVKEPDGSRSTTSRSYKNATDYTEKSYEYYAGTGREITYTADYGEEGYPLHSLRTIRDGGSETSLEVWYIDLLTPSKYIEKDADGLVTQTDYTYNEAGDKLSTISVSSNGDIESEEWRYGEDGSRNYYKQYSYDAALNKSETSELSASGTGEHISYYTINLVDYGNGTVFKTEYWLDGQDELVNRIVRTLPDGSQITENYSYNSDGQETLYTKSEGDTVTARRQTTYRGNETETVSVDSSATTTVTSSTDPRTGRTTEEQTAQYKDGTRRYTKEVLADGIYPVSYQIQETYSDGTGFSSESIYNSDGSNITTEHWEDGTVVVIGEDADETTVSYSLTLPDGTTGVTAWERREDGQPTSRTVSYSDGSMDRIVYEYDADGELIKETEMRRNGISAVTEMVPESAGSDNGVMTITFNNGFQVVNTFVETEDSNFIEIAYSAGDIAKVTFRYENDLFLIQTTYRDGRTEETTRYIPDTNAYYEARELLNTSEDYYDDFLEQAWSYVPAQTEAQADAQMDTQADAQADTQADAQAAE